MQFQRSSVRGHHYTYKNRQQGHNSESYIFGVIPLCHATAPCQDDQLFQI